MRPIRRVFEHLSLEQMLHLENPQDHAMEYALEIPSINVDETEEGKLETNWLSLEIPSSVKLATDPRNPLKQYY
jgi:hypothetical protein